MPQYEYSQTEQFQIVATQQSQQVLFTQTVFVIEIYNLSAWYAFVHEEGNVAATIQNDAPIYPVTFLVGQVTYYSPSRPTIIRRLIRQEWGISVISQTDNADLRIVGRF